MPAPVNLSDARARQAAAKRIAKEAMKSDPDDPMEALNPLDRQFFGGERVALHFPLTRGSRLARACFEDLYLAIPSLLAEMDCLDSERSKLLLLQTRVRRWNHAFKRRMGPKDTPSVPIADDV